MAPRAVLFDLDGTLTDTEEVWDKVRRNLAANAGVEWHDEYTTAMMGMATHEWSHYCSEVVGLPVPPEEAARMTVQGMVEHYLTGPRILPGAVEAVERMAKQYPVALVSSSPRVLIETAAQVLGIDHLLKATVSTEECQRGKPAPDGYLRACELLDVVPSKTVAVEDSQVGILSALNAGLSVVACPQEFHRPDDEVLASTTLVSTLDELTLDLVESLG